MEGGADFGQVFGRKEEVKQEIDHFLSCSLNFCAYKRNTSFCIILQLLHVVGANQDDQRVAAAMSSSMNLHPSCLFHITCTGKQSPSRDETRLLFSSSYLNSLEKSLGFAVFCMRHGSTGPWRLSQRRPLQSSATKLPSLNP